MTAARFIIDGMHCGGCVTRVTTALKSLPSVTVQTVAVGTAQVEYDEKAVAPDAMVNALGKMGFDARIEPTPASTGGN